MTKQLINNFMKNDKKLLFQRYHFLHYIWEQKKKKFC